MDFATMAQMKVEDLPEPKLLPMGSYVWSVDRVPEMKASKSGTSQMIEVRARCVGPVLDFDGDETALEEFGPPAGIIRIMRLIYPIESYPDEDEKQFENRQASAMKRIVTFFRSHLGTEGSNLNEMISASLNHQFVGTVTHRPDQNDELRDEIQTTAPVDS